MSDTAREPFRLRGEDKYSRLLSDKGRADGYIPSHDRPGFSEKLVIKLPSGWSGQTTDHWGNEVKRKNRDPKLASRYWNGEAK